MCISHLSYSRERVTVQHKSQLALAWLDDFAYSYADIMPDSGQQHLPTCLTRCAVYEQMRDDLHEKGEVEIVSQSHFLYLWRSLRRTIAIPKVGNIINSIF